MMLPVLWAIIRKLPIACIGWLAASIKAHADDAGLVTRKYGVASPMDHYSEAANRLRRLAATSIKAHADDAGPVTKIVRRPSKGGMNRPRHFSFSV